VLFDRLARRGNTTNPHLRQQKFNTLTQEGSACYARDLPLRDARCQRKSTDHTKTNPHLRQQKFNTSTQEGSTCYARYQKRFRNSPDVQPGRFCHCWHVISVQMELEYRTNQNQPPIVATEVQRFYCFQPGVWNCQILNQVVASEFFCSIDSSNGFLTSSSFR
jgi:hypothetical protein